MRTSLLGRAGEAAAWAISAVAWALSFAAQMQLASVHGFASWEVWAWPATTDLAGLTGMLIALDQARHNRSTRVAWTIAAAAAAVMVAANIGAAVGDVVAMIMHAWPPSIALACWYLLVHVRRAPKADMNKDMIEDSDTMAEDAQVAGIRPRPRPARQQVAALVRRHGADITTDMIALRLGISTRHASRLLAEVKRPTVISK